MLHWWNSIKESRANKYSFRGKVRAAEDILSLTRSMKETWLFGKLDTLGEDERDIKRKEQIEQDADVVKSAIEEGGFLQAARKE